MTGIRCAWGGRIDGMERFGLGDLEPMARLATFAWSPPAAGVDADYGACAGWTWLTAPAKFGCTLRSSTIRSYWPGVMGMSFPRGRIRGEANRRPTRPAARNRNPRP